MPGGFNVDLITQGRQAKRGHRLCAGGCGASIPIRGGKLYCAECSDARRRQTLREYNRRRPPRSQQKG